MLICASALLPTFAFMNTQTPTSSLLLRDKNTIWHPDTQMQTSPPPIPVVAGRDTFLIDENGNEYLDMISSWWVNLHGHAHPYIAQKVSEQVQKLEHCIFADFTHPPAVELAERLLEILPSNFSKVFYSDNGSTAVEVGLKMAIQYWFNQGISKTKILAFKNGYHGDTFGSMSVSSRSVFTHPFEEYLFEVEYLDIPVINYRGGGIATGCTDTYTLIPDDSYFQQAESLLASNEFAAFIFEPLVLGAGGMLMYAPEALERLIKIARKHNVLIIADEVMTGFGRTAKRFASEYLSSQPDIICLSKGLTGGTMALGVTACNQKIYDAFLSTDKLKTFLHGHSFTANPVACAAALASLDLFLDPPCEENINRIAEQHAFFRKKINGHPAIKEVRQTGTIVAFDVITGEADSYSNNIRDFLYQYFLEKRIILRPLGNILYILPPYCTTNEQLNYVYETIYELLNKLKKQ